MTRAFAMIMAGGSSESLSVLTEVRAEPAVPFGGKFRLVDFPLSNCVNSEIYNVAVLTQYRPHSLNDHIGLGKPWDLDRARGGLRLLQPYQGGQYGDWQRGTADAVRRNLDYVGRRNEEHALILAGNHIYTMDYRPMLRQHVERNADVTVAVHTVNPHEVHRFGIVQLDADQRIVAFEEKPKQAREPLASMGIYLFRKELLGSILEKNEYLDFGRDMLPDLVGSNLSVHAYRFSGYWANVSTTQAYWEANMSLLAENPALDLYNTSWVIRTRSKERAPVKIGANAEVGGNLLSNGCRIEGHVQGSIISPGVVIGEGAVVRNSVVLGDTLIEPGVVVDRCVIDVGVRIGANAQIGHGDDNTANTSTPSQLNTGLTLLGRRSVVPKGVTIGRNVVIHPETQAKAFGKRKNIASGENIGKSLR